MGLRVGWVTAGGLAVVVTVVAAGVLVVRGVRGGGGRAAGTAVTTAPVKATAAVPVTTDRQLTVDGLTRRYIVVRPAAAATKAGGKLPVVVVLHGRNATPELEEQRTGFGPLAGPAILVYPAGYQESWNAGSCCAGAHEAGVDDVAFLTGVVHRVLSTEPDADAGRVFLVGFSNGGKMAYRLACADPTLFAGLAVVGAVPVSTCAQPPAVPAALLAFDHDPLLTLTPAEPPKPVNGFPQASLDEEAAALRSADGCTGAGDRSVTGTLTTTTWTDCATGKPMEFGIYQGNIHVWPAGDAQTPSAEQVIWTFFRSLPEDPR
ncbi:MAG TPA: PHB depolymerase family esterase [Acidimicrobiia bacterium]|nr:PHB depolymerase family esterase [Acidimicrobiia bacterium]